MLRVAGVCALIVISACTNNVKNKYHTEENLILPGKESVEFNGREYSVLSYDDSVRSFGCEGWRFANCRVDSRFAGVSITTSAAWVKQDSGAIKRLAVSNSEDEYFQYMVRPNVMKLTFDLYSGQKNGFFIEIRPSDFDRFSDIVERENCSGANFCELIFIGTLKRGNCRAKYSSCVSKEVIYLEVEEIVHSSTINIASSAFQGVLEVGDIIKALKAYSIGGSKSG